MSFELSEVYVYAAVLNLTYFSFQGEGALAIGTQVSAKYKGAFCEAKVRSVDKQVKCRVTFKMGLGSTTISDKDIKTDKPLVQGATVLAKHPDKHEFLEAIVKEIKVRIVKAKLNQTNPT